MHRKLEIQNIDRGVESNKFSDLINGRVWTLLVLLFVGLVVSSKSMGVVKFLMYCIYLLIFTFCISSDLKIIIKSIFFILPLVGFLTIMFLPYFVRMDCNSEKLLLNLCINKEVGKHFLEVIGRVFLCTFNLVVYVKSLTKTKVIEALQWMGIPRSVTKIISITLVYFDILVKELGKIKIAIRLRLFSERSLLVYWKLITFSIGMLFLRSYRKIIYLYSSLRLRGYRGVIYEYKSTPLSVGDFVFFIVMVSLLLLIKISLIVYY